MSVALPAPHTCANEVPQTFAPVREEILIGITGWSKFPVLPYVCIYVCMFVFVMYLSMYICRYLCMQDCVLYMSDTSVVFCSVLFCSVQYHNRSFGYFCRAIYSSAQERQKKFCSGPWTLEAEMSGKEWNGFPKGQMSPKVCTTANHNRPFYSVMGISWQSPKSFQSVVSLNNLLFSLT